MSPQDERSAGGAGLGVAAKEDPISSADSPNVIDKPATFIFVLCQWFGNLVIGYACWALLKLGLVFKVFGRGINQLKSYMRRAVRRFAVQNDIPIDEVKANFNALMAGSKAAGEAGIGRFAGFWATRIAGVLLQGILTVLTNRDYFLPTAASAAFLAVVITLTQLNFGLSVSYNGEHIGYIADVAAFNRAETQVQGRIVYEDYIPPEDNVPEFKMVIVKNEDLTTVNELTNRLIMASGNDISEAYGLYVDGSFQGAVTSERLVAGLLDSLLDKHRTGDPTETVEFVQDVEVREGLYPVTSITTLDKLEANATRLVAQQRIYTVQRGDAPTLIAQRNNIAYADLKKLNPDIEKKLLVGQEVLLSQEVPFIGVKLVKEETYEESIPFEIQRTVDATKAQGSITVNQVGKTGTKEIKAKVSYVDGVEQDRVILDSRTVQEPVTEKVIVGGKVAAAEIPVTTTYSTSSSTFLWPVEGGGRVTCGFYGYYGHTGTDIALRSGAAIRASMAGTVTLVKYSSYGYGYHVMIDHGGGVQTLYAHNSAIYVTQGQWVEQGQAIAAMGRTGRVTGVHLHFEIRINNKYMNPANYIGTTPY